MWDLAIFVTLVVIGYVVGMRMADKYQFRLRLMRVEPQTELRQIHRTGSKLEVQTRHESN